MLPAAAGRRENVVEWITVVALAVLAAVACYRATRLFDPVILDWQTGDVFFSADVPRVFHNLIDRRSNYFRTTVHPLFALFVYPAGLLLRKMVGLDPVTAVRALLATVAGLWTAAIFVLLRRLGCRRADAVLFTVLAATSASAMFWFAVPECYSFGSLTILAALLFATEAEKRRLSPNAYVAINVATAGITVTNAMVGALITLVFQPWRAAVRIACAAGGIVLLLSVLQMTLFATAKLPMLSLWQEVSWYTRADPVADSGGVATSFALHSMVMPATRLLENDKSPQWPKLRTQHGRLRWATGWGTVGAATWIILLALGVWGMVQLTSHHALRIVLFGTLAGQLALHLVYGDETFLYSLHWAPLLVMVAASSTLTRARPLALTLCAALILLAGINNVAQLRAAAAYFATDAGERATFPIEDDRR